MIYAYKRFNFYVFFVLLLRINIGYAEPDMNANFKSTYDCSPSGLMDQLSPPYNRTTGRDGNSCLKWYSHCPKMWEVGGYFQYCAQSTQDSSYFDPKIKVQFETCNFGCWSDSVTLRGYGGECKIFPTGYGIPTVRICARIARPISIINKSSDPGMDATSQFVHHNYNNVGQLVEDQKYKRSDGTSDYLTSAKLCAYDDPGLIQGLFNLGTRGDEADFFDIDPNSQPVHEGGKGSNPVMDALQVSLSLITNGPAFSATFGKAVVGMISGTGLDISFLNPVIDFICKLVSFFGNAFADLIKQYLQINRVVKGNLGCVNIPLGPYPPPYCDSIPKGKPTPITFAICRQYADKVEEPSKTNNCILSDGSGSNRNNIIHNTIRVAFQNLIQLCKPNEIGPIDSCVKIQRAYSPKQLHDKNDVIATCPGNFVDPCVEISQEMRKSINFYLQTARVVYGIDPYGDGKVRRMDYYPDVSYSNQNPSILPTNKSQVAVWGIDAANFQDITVDLSGKAIAYHDDDKQHFSSLDAERITNTTVVDSSYNQRKFTAVVVLDPKNTKPQYQDQSMTEICVYEEVGTEQRKIGCQSRLPKIPDTIIKRKEDKRTLEEVRAEVRNDIDNAPVSKDLQMKILTDISNIKISSYIAKKISDDMATAPQSIKDEIQDYINNSQNTLDDLNTKITNIDTNELNVEIKDQMLDDIKALIIPNDTKLTIVNDINNITKLSDLKIKLSDDFNQNKIPVAVSTAVLNEINASMIPDAIRIKMEEVLNNARNLGDLRSGIGNYLNQIPNDIKNKITEDIKDQSSSSSTPSITYLTQYIQKPLVYAHSSASIIDDYFQPKIEIKLCGSSDCQDYVYGDIEAPNISNTIAYKNKINLAGFVYDSFVTDNQINMVPFAGASSGDNGTSLNTNFLALYSNGLVYNQKLYVFGGEKICINNPYTKDCPSNKSHCVLAQTINYSPQIKAVSQNPLDRINPTSSLSPLLDSQFFDPNTEDNNIKDKVNNNIYAIRNKTPFEENLCVDINVPHCAAIQSPVDKPWLASWPETELGEYAIGQCQEGYRKKEVKRRCIVMPASSNKYTIGFEPLNKNNQCNIEGYCGLRFNLSNLSEEEHVDNSSFGAFYKTSILNCDHQSTDSSFIYHCSTNDFFKKIHEIQDQDNRVNNFVRSVCFDIIAGSSFNITINTAFNLNKKISLPSIVNIFVNKNNILGGQYSSSVTSKINIKDNDNIIVAGSNRICFDYSVFNILDLLASDTNLDFSIELKYSCSNP